MSRRLKSILPTASKLMKPQTLNHKTIKKALINKQESQKKNYDKDAKLKPELNNGENVRILKNNNWSQIAKVIGKHDTPRSYVVKTPDGTTYRRNSRHLLKDTTQTENVQENTDNTVPSQKSVLEPSAPKVKTPSPLKTTSEQPYITRYGRQVKPRCLSKDFVTK